MKYLFIFLPIFCFAQGGDSTLYGVRFDSIITHDNFIATPNSSGFIANRFGLYYRGQKPKVIESFKYLGAYYELRENGWYKEILPDTLPVTLPPGKIANLEQSGLKIKGDSVFQWAETPWIPCDQHFGNVDHPKRDKIEQSEVKILVWTGCALAEYKATKFYGYNLYDDQFFMSGGTMKRIQKDFIAWYLVVDKWIKSSHVIKEL